MINKEVSGYYLNQSGAPDFVSNIYMGRYINNNATMSKKGGAQAVNSMTLNGTHQVHTDWHTHPTNAPTADRLRPSGLHDNSGDIRSKNNVLGYPNPNQRLAHFMILTRGYAPILLILNSATLL